MSIVNGNPTPLESLNKHGGTMTGTIASTAVPAIKSGSDTSDLVLGDEVGGGGSNITFKGKLRGDDSGNVEIRSENAEKWSSILQKPDGNFEVKSSNTDSSITILSSNNLDVGKNNNKLSFNNTTIDISKELRFISTLYPAIGTSSSSSRLLLFGGPGVADGAALFLHGNDYENGEFILETMKSDATTSNDRWQLRGNRNGTLTWGGPSSGHNLLTDWANLKSGNGYQRLDNGFQICWGVFYESGNQAESSVALPIPFKDTNWKVTITESDWNLSLPHSSHVMSTRPITSSTYFQLLYTNGASACYYPHRCFYIAVGYWK